MSLFYLTTMTYNFPLTLRCVCGLSVLVGKVNTVNEQMESDREKFARQNNNPIQQHKPRKKTKYLKYLIICQLRMYNSKWRV
jgi:hypothetical protein